MHAKLTFDRARGPSLKFDSVPSKVTRPISIGTSVYSLDSLVHVSYFSISI